jgi:hypothetical protein
LFGISFVLSRFYFDYELLGLSRDCRIAKKASNFVQVALFWGWEYKYTSEKKGWLKRALKREICRISFWDFICVLFYVFVVFVFWDFIWVLFYVFVVFVFVV